VDRMKTHQHGLTSLRALAGSAVLLAGCLSDPDGHDPAESETAANIIEANGISLNGISLNGISLNGMSLNGISLNGISLNGTRVNGISLNGVSVSGTQLQGIKSTGGSVTGAAMVGATLKGVLSNGSNLDLRIDASALLPAPNADVRTYTITYATTTGPKPLCVGPTGENEAILFPGTWNLTTVRHQADWNMSTVSCRGATFAKCEELGYKGDSLLDTYHQACVRALRADYCGDGQSHTVNGTQINIYDRLGKQTDNQTWSIESNWTTEGAICIGKGRLGTALTTPTVPQCMASRATIPCATTTWPGGVLIRTEVNL
jgi:hypothetical protein